MRQPGATTQSTALLPRPDEQGRYYYEIVVFSYRDGSTLMRCLENVVEIVAGSRPGRGCCYLVDDGSGFPEIQAYCDAKGLALILEPNRLGKSMSIHEAIREAAAPILILVGGDGVPSPGVAEAALEIFKDSRVGGIGGRNIPVNAREGLVPSAMALLWELHHKINLLRPKLGGDIYAIRTCAVIGDTLAALDDAGLEACIVRSGFKIAYCPSLSVQMRVPTSLRDAVLQRRKIIWGYRQIEALGHRVSTRDRRLVARCILGSIKGPRSIGSVALLLLIEGLATCLAGIDRMRRTDHSLWRIADSTRGDMIWQGEDER